MGARPVALLGLAGLAALAVSWRRERGTRVATLAQLLLLGVALPSCEIWYAVYLAPLTYLGVAHALRGLGLRRPWGWAVSAVFAILALSFASLNAGRLATGVLSRCRLKSLVAPLPMGPTRRPAS